jgi:hypothetical protein
MTRVAVGRDIESASLLAFATSYRGTSTTAPTATTFTTDGVNIPVNSVVGQMIVVGSVFGIIQSNTSAANSVLTIDRWYDITALPANVNAAAASTLRRACGRSRRARSPRLHGSDGDRDCGCRRRHGADRRAQRGRCGGAEPPARDLRAHGGGHDDDADEDVHGRGCGHVAGDGRPDRDLPGCRARGVADGVPHGAERDATLSAIGDQLQVTETVTL